MLSWPMLTQDSFQEDIQSISFGKKLPEAVYFYRECLFDLDLPTVNTLKVLYEKVLNQNPDFNVIKMFTREFKVSFLSYPNFIEHAHPQLCESLSIHLATGKMRKFDYANSKNPPILHRKEEFLNPVHPLRSRFSRLTEAEESEGLYENTTTIGFKQNWDNLLAEKGVKIVGHSLEVDLEAKQNKDTESQVEVERHRTALSRFNFSKPVQTILENNLLGKEATLFDYGCGLGDDVEGLKKLGHTVWGWDPNHKPDGEQEKAEIVNLGFVINVIEDPAERVQVLKRAYSFANKLLVVSAMLMNANQSDAQRLYSDGVITSRNTFQKYFEQDELRQYIQDVLEVPEAIAAGPGIFYVFKKAEDRQAYLSSKSRVKINWDQVSAKVFGAKPKASPKKLYDKHPDEFNAFFREILQLGRLPLPEEYEKFDEFKEICSPKRAYRMFLERFGSEILEEIGKHRKRDLLVYLALSNFQTKVPFKDLPKSLKQDIKTFLGGYQIGRDQGLQLLFQISDEELIQELCDDCAFGYLDEQALYIRQEQLDLIHPILRIYVGCGERLYGDSDEFDLIKIHKLSGKVTFLKYDNFEKKILPELKLRVKVNLALRKIHYFDYSSYYRKQLLYHKVRFFEEDEENYSKYKRHSEKLIELGIGLDSYGPSKDAFLEMIEHEGLTENLFRKRG